MASYRTWSFGPVNFTTLQPESVAQNSDSRPAVIAEHLIPVRLTESESGWTVEADVPGVDPSNIRMEFFQNRLSIGYQRETPDISKSPYDNRAYGEFQRVIKVAEEVNAEGITASIAHGVLTVSLPRSEANQPRKIVVNSL
ncbi:MAG: Hsp20/alpha crystallin family protein [bacterium]